MYSLSALIPALHIFISGTVSFDISFSNFHIGFVMKVTGIFSWNFLSRAVRSSDSFTFHQSSVKKSFKFIIKTQSICFMLLQWSDIEYHLIFMYNPYVFHLQFIFPMIWNAVLSVNLFWSVNWIPLYHRENIEGRDYWYIEVFAYWKVSSESIFNFEYYRSWSMLLWKTF